jgi:hypothetical protein
MEIPGLTTQAMKSRYDQNRYMYNAIEHDTTFGLDSYQAYYRNLDPETGRLWQMDPKSELAINPEVESMIEDQQYVEGLESISPYASMNDAPVRYRDTKGDAVYCYLAKAWSTFKTTQRIADVIEVVGGGSEDPVADAAAALVEVGGVAKALLDLFSSPTIVPLAGHTPKFSDGHSTSCNEFKGGG